MTSYHKRPETINYTPMGISAMASPLPSTVKASPT